MSTGRKRDRWHVVALALVVVGSVELCAYVAARVLVDQGLLFRPRTAEGYATYRERRDPLLGWPSPGAFGQGEYDASGSRITPEFPDPQQRSCVALFGDSFTWGAEVAAEHAYGNVLAQRLGCRVANYGVGGYGTDQSFLRYARRIDDPAPRVVLGHFSENIVRNVNQVRDLIGGLPFGMKPRFVIDANGALQLVPLPDLTADEYAALGRRAAELLSHEHFLPESPWGSPLMRAPYVVSVLRVLGHHRVRARWRGEASYAPFYAADHPSGALQVTVAILVQFVELAQARGQHPTVVLIPEEKDLVALRKHGKLPYASLTEALEARGISTPPVAESLLTSLGDRAPCALYTRCGGAHFNPEGYARLADIVHDWLSQDGLRADTEH